MYVCMPVCRKATCGNIAVCNPLKINHVYRKICTLRRTPLLWTLTMLRTILPPYIFSTYPTFAHVDNNNNIIIHLKIKMPPMTPALDTSISLVTSNICFLRRTHENMRMHQEDSKKKTAMLSQCWVSVEDAGLTPRKHWHIASPVQSRIRTVTTDYTYS